MHGAEVAESLVSAAPAAGRSVFLAVCLGAFIGAAGTAAAEAGPHAMSFDIPSQPLEAALDAYGAASHIQILYEAALAAGRQSTAVSGVYTPDEALRRLLSRTGLDFDVTEERAVTLVPARAALLVPGAGGTAPGVAGFGHFLGGVQAGILAALCEQPRLRPGAYRVALQLRIGSSGAVQQPILLSSTGVPARDAAILDSLAHLSFSEGPPANMPQPVTLVMTPGGQGETCGEGAK